MSFFIDVIFVLAFYVGSAIVIASVINSIEEYGFVYPRKTSAHLLGIMVSLIIFTMGSVLLLDMCDIQPNTIISSISSKYFA